MACAGTIGCRCAVLHTLQFNQRFDANRSNVNQSIIYVFIYGNGCNEDEDGSASTPIDCAANASEFARARLPFDANFAFTSKTLSHRLHINLAICSNWSHSSRVYFVRLSDDINRFEQSLRCVYVLSFRSIGLFAAIDCCHPLATPDKCRRCFCEIQRKEIISPLSGAHGNEIDQCN